MLIISVTATAQTHKLSSMVRQMTTSHDLTVRTKGKAAADQRRGSFFVRTSNIDDIRSCDGHIMASFGDIHIVNMPISKVRTLAQYNSVSRIEAGRSCTALLDSTAVSVRMPEVWNYQLPDMNGVKLRGNGVVMGLMDIGFDLTNPMFRTADSSSLRIKALWDQLDRTGGGAPVTGTDTTFLGRQYVGEEQLLALGHSYDGKAMNHGTMTATIAAGNNLAFAPQALDSLRKFLVKGNAQAEIFSGMAPEAELCLVANFTGNNKDSVPSELRDMYNNTLDAMGFKYIFDYAESCHKPCVISFSEGSYPDVYGDDQLYAEVLNSMLGPGRILCAAAGNESHRVTYLPKPIGKESATAFIEAKPGHSYYTLRGSDHFTVRITVHPKDGSKEVFKDYNSSMCILDEDAENANLLIDTLYANGRKYDVKLISYPSCYDSQQWAMELAIGAPDGGYVGYKDPMSLTLLDKNISSELFTSGGYLARNKNYPDLFDGENTHNIHTPGGLPGIICVGSTNSRMGFRNYKKDMEWMNWGDYDCHSGYSSVGPSMCGEIKPDVSAPGCVIAAASNSFYDENNTYSWVVAPYEWNGRTYSWHIDSGTSMACPAAAGVIATWLQACPTLTPEQALSAIAATATKPGDFESYDTFTDAKGNMKNNVYGYGIINAIDGLKYILDHYTGISNITLDNQHPSTTYDLMGRHVTTLMPGNIYIRNGKKIIIK